MPAIATAVIFNIILWVRFDFLKYLCKYAFSPLLLWQGYARYRKVFITVQYRTGWMVGLSIFTGSIYLHSYSGTICQFWTFGVERSLKAVFTTL